MRIPEYRVWVTAPKESWLGCDEYETFDWDNRMRMVSFISFPLGSYSGKDLSVEAISEPDYYAEGWLGANYSKENTIESFDYILMEYTGLKDKNGVKIFEGDIVQYYKHGYEDDGEYECYHVAWTNDCYGEKWGWDLLDSNGNCREYYYGGFDECKCVVIGNIHQNPELL